MLERSAVSMIEPGFCRSSICCGMRRHVKGSVPLEVTTQEARRLVGIPVMNKGGCIEQNIETRSGVPGGSPRRSPEAGTLVKSGNEYPVNLTHICCIRIVFAAAAVAEVLQILQCSKIDRHCLTARIVQLCVVGVLMRIHSVSADAPTI
jgi:hypothetical protein